MALRARVDGSSCRCSGKCIEAAPEHFAWSEDHVAEFRSGPGALPHETLLAIARGCPALAIAVLDSEGNEVDF